MKLNSIQIYNSINFFKKDIQGGGYNLEACVANYYTIEVFVELSPLKRLLLAFLSVYIYEVNHYAFRLIHALKQNKVEQNK